MANDDPWDWDVERVVQELCTSSRSWTPRSTSAARPDASKLAEALRHHEIDGPILLNDINDAELRDDLGLTKLAHKSFIRHAIAELKLKSVQYSAYMEKHQPSHNNIPADTLHRGIQCLQQQVRSLHSSISGFPLVHGKIARTELDGLGDGEEQIGEPSSKRLRLEAIDTNDEAIEQAFNDLPSMVVEPADVGSIPTPSSIDLPDLEKKRKRIAPTLITTMIDPSRNREIGTAADHVIIYRTPEPHSKALAEVVLEEHAEPLPQPGVTFVGKDGRKRMVPITHSQPTLGMTPAYDDRFKQPGNGIDGEESATSRTSRIENPSTQRTAVDLPAMEYLGKKALPVDQLFYSVAPGEEIEDTEEITDFFHQQEISSGKRQYVSKIMKNFLRSEWKGFKRGEERLVALHPYSKKLIPQFQQASITLYSAKNGQIGARREHAQNWPEIDAENAQHANIDARLASFNPLGPDFQLGSSYDDWDPSALDKYNYLDGGDELLPLYGDSDSDNEYDDATWREIEREQKKPAEGGMRASRRPVLNQQDVNDAIDDGIAQLVEIWKVKCLPKLEKKAWRVWMKSRKRGTKLLQILAAENDIKGINHRLEKLRDKILQGSWTSRLQVIRQTTSMELTVFPRESLLWTIATLRQKQIPSKPDPSPAIESFRKQKLSFETKRGQDEDGESIDSQSEASSSEDGLDKFVAEDEEKEKDEYNVEEEEELAILPADSEDEDVPMSDHRALSSSPEPDAFSDGLVTPSKPARARSSSQTLSQNDLTLRIRNEIPTKKLRTLTIEGTDFIDLTFTSSDDATPQKQPPRWVTPINHTPQKQQFLREQSVIELNIPPRIKINFQKQPSAIACSSQSVEGDLDDGLDVSVPLESIDDGDNAPVAAHPRRPIQHNSEEDLLEEDSSRKKKKHFVENADAREMRLQDKQRRAEQEARRKKLHAKLNQLGLGDGTHSQIIVNDGAAEGHFILNDYIAQHIKKHQITGIRFLWASTITESQDLQGCLLAHMMGLGKTMQAITLLVAIAEASASKDPVVCGQIPERLRTSKTLVLCPPGLINNWMDELLIWVNPNNLLGELRKIDASMLMGDRLHSISEWYKYGGVLVLGYEMFRDFVLNKKTLKRDPRLNEEQHKRIMKELVRGPNIVIADEAHKMKSATSGLTKAAVQLETKCRIALTGSPLANNIAEYHTMIDWVAPNYLGPAREFRAKFVDPIQQGLYGDSTTSEKRYALKMLSVLEKDIDPKVSRADMSVLKNDLPLKTEFTITVALTDLQRAAYTLYVRSMTTSNKNSFTKDGDIKTATLWQWLAVLILLCNHPSTFKAKLAERFEDAAAKVATNSGSREATDGEDTTENDFPFDLNSQLKVDMSQDLIDKENELFNSVDDINDVDLSNKARILCQILDAANVAGDKTLVFSQSIPTLDYIEQLCRKQQRRYYRLDGKTRMDTRQAQTKVFNDDDNPINVFLISTTAGGLGLNLPGANRVVIFDFKFNPIQEEQAIGRAYRIGQKKETFVYRLIAGGTFETSVHNKTIFKQQLASRVVDKKSILAMAIKKGSDFLLEPTDVNQEDLSEFEGVDPLVLDKILESQSTHGSIRKIVQSDIFEKDDEEKLTAEELEEVAQLHREETLKRKNGGILSVPLGSREQHSGHQSPAMQKFDALYETVVITPQPQMAFGMSGAIPVATTPPAVFLPPPHKSPQPATFNSTLKGQRGQSPIVGPNVRVVSQQEPLASSDDNSVSKSIRIQNDQMSSVIVNGSGVSSSVKSSTDKPTSIIQPSPRDWEALNVISPVKSSTPSSSRDGSGVHFARRSSKIFSRSRNSAAGSPHRRSHPSGEDRTKILPPTKNKMRLSHDGSIPTSSIEERSRTRPSQVDRTKRLNDVQQTERSDMLKAKNRRLPPVQSLKTPVTTKPQKRDRDGGKDVGRGRRRSSMATDSATTQLSSLTSTVAARPLPDWAHDQLRKTDESRRLFPQNFSTPSRKVPPKDGSST